MSEQIKIQLTADSEDGLTQLLLEVASEYRTQGRIYSTSKNLEDASQLVLSINLTNIEDDAFMSDPIEEMSRIFGELASKITNMTNCALMDVSGNSIGRAIVYTIGSLNPAPSKLQEEAEKMFAQFREAYLYKVKHLSKSGALDESELDGGFLKICLLLAAEEWQPRPKKYKEMTENLRNF